MYLQANVEFHAMILFPSIQTKISECEALIRELVSQRTEITQLRRDGQERQRKAKQDASEEEDYERNRSKSLHQQICAKVRAIEPDSDLDIDRLIHVSLISLFDINMRERERERERESTNLFSVTILFVQ